MLMRLPDRTSLYLDGQVLDFSPDRTCAPEGEVIFDLSGGALTVRVRAPEAGGRWVRLGGGLVLPGRGGPPPPPPARPRPASAGCACAGIDP